jgi:hypothetical protein
VKFNPVDITNLSARQEPLQINGYRTIKVVQTPREHDSLSNKLDSYRVKRLEDGNPFVLKVIKGLQEIECAVELQKAENPHIIRLYEVI